MNDRFIFPIIANNYFNIVCNEQKNLIFTTFHLYLQQRSIMTTLIQDLTFKSNFIKIANYCYKKKFKASIKLHTDAKIHFWVVLHNLLLSNVSLNVWKKKFFSDLLLNRYTFIL